ncbi:DNA and RNA helicase [Iocasia frigidifontis]|uniref:DNA and RNA helicase n=1 Tax=Iocasia fonsfrigidae TaxID=2682810 RepID=A0A8A7KA30_9FIRM|nr:hypothetical protein [Iocasia fonsfrigidae]QTL98663.1 DNA and RNA helicase [Iocasia fonsfrigidae]
MFKNNTPYFKRGNILKKGMLMNLRDYPRKFFDFYFQDYSNGVIAGSSIFIEDKYFCVNEGIVKFNDIIYISDGISRVKYFNSNKEMIVKIKFRDKREEKDYSCYESDIIVDDNLQIEENELELGRFKLREGAYLRSEYNNFSDFETEFNTVNIINVLYANVSRPTLHPSIVEKFANNLLELSQDDFIDIAFAMECLNSRMVRRDLLENYLNRKLELKKERYTNLDIYKHMKNIIKELLGNRVIKDEGRKAPKIIVD